MNTHTRLWAAQRILRYLAAIGRQVAIELAAVVATIPWAEQAESKGHALLEQRT